MVAYFKPGDRVVRSPGAYHFQCWTPGRVYVIEDDGCVRDNAGVSHFLSSPGHSQFHLAPPARPAPPEPVTPPDDIRERALAYMLAHRDHDFDQYVAGFIDRMARDVFGVKVEAKPQFVPV